MHPGYGIYESIKIICVCAAYQYDNGPLAPPKGLYSIPIEVFPFRTACENPSLYDPGQANHTRPARYHAVTVQDCIPKDNISFGEALAALGIHLISDFSLQVFDPWPLSDTSFQDLSPFLDNVHLSSTGDVLVPESGALVGLRSVTRLELSRVRPDRLPPNLETLDVTHCGYEELPPGALDVQELTVIENNLKTISGSAPRLQRLSVIAPALETVSLEDVSSDVVRGVWRRCPALRSLRLRRLRGEAYSLLRSTEHLTSFTLQDTNFISLPINFFQHSRSLTDIDISDNSKLQYLPKKLFDGLDNLKNLRLENNQLSARALLPIVRAAALQNLQLSGNMLGDLCSECSSMRQLPALRVMDLARTGATRICSDCLHSAQSIRILDLSHNNIEEVECATLVEYRDYPLLLNLTGNRLQSFKCSREEYKTAVMNKYPVQVFYQWKDHSLPCDCSTYWLWRIYHEGSGAVRDKNMKCLPRWRVCHPEDAQEQYIYDNGRSYQAFCKKVSLDELEQPAEHGPVGTNYVTLVSCTPPPKGTYMKSLKDIHITVQHSLRLFDIPAQTGFLASWLEGLPSSLRELRIRASGAATKPGSVAKSGRFELLNLTTIPINLLPPRMEVVELRGTGLETLDAEAFHEANSIMLEEENLTSFTGTAPLLTRLWLSAPVVTLPKAPWLTILSLYNAAATEPLDYPKLHSLTLNQMLLLELPIGLLQKCKALVNFVASKNKFTSIPADLFAYSPILEKVDLSNNRLTSLPRELFRVTKSLKSLNLAFNQLTAKHLVILRPLTTLKILDVSNNPLGDLCPNKADPILSTLKGLVTLSLSNTQLQKVCPDWIHDMRDLDHLDLTFNLIESITCTDLRVDRNTNEASTPTIMLTNNNIKNVYCDWSDHEVIEQRGEPAQWVKVVASVHLSCTCGHYWLARIKNLLKFGILYFEVTFDKCSFDMERRCRVRTRCPPTMQNRCDVAAMTDNQDIYYVDGQKFILRYDNGNYYTATCTSKVNLDNPAWPVLARNESFTTVELHGCAPPSYSYLSYSSALKKLNVTVTQNFYLYDLPASFKIRTRVFQDLPHLKLLHLEAASGLITLYSGYMQYIQPLSSLYLVRVHVDAVPPYLDHLNLTDTGLEELHKEARTAKELTIIEKNPISLGGYSSRMKRLSLTGPVKDLIQAPRLKVLEMTGAEPGAGFVSEYPGLLTLRLRELKQTVLPAQFLRGPAKLRNLEITHSPLRSLPLDLFHYTLNLETIDLSNNELQILPTDLFVGLTQVRVLNLENNRLLVKPDLESLPALQELKFDGNASR